MSAVLTKLTASGRVRRLLVFDAGDYPLRMVKKKKRAKGRHGAKWFKLGKRILRKLKELNTSIEIIAREIARRSRGE